MVGGRLVDTGNPGDVSLSPVVVVATDVMFFLPDCNRLSILAVAVRIRTVSRFE